MRLALLAGLTLLPAAAVASDCPPDEAPALHALATAVAAATTLGSAPGAARFADAWAAAFESAVRQGSGTDGRLSVSEASRLDGVFADDARLWLAASGQRSVSVDKLVALLREAALLKGKEVAGSDGRISWADAEKLPLELRADYAFLRGSQVTPPPTPAALEGRVRDALRARTGIDAPFLSVLESHADGADTWARVNFGRGFAELKLTANGEIRDLSIVEPPLFVDPETKKDLQNVLANDFGIHANILATGVAPSPGTLWHLYTREGSQERMRALSFNANGTRSLATWSYDEEAFRSLAIPLVVEHALSLAGQSGDEAAKLEVFLKGNRLLDDPSLLSVVSQADSPVGFDPAKEVQLVAGSMWGDNAVYVTIDKTTGLMRTDDFN